MNVVNNTSQNNTLIATKLHVPRVYPSLLTRHALLERLDEGLQLRLTVITAPAGFGKTTLLGQWINERCPFAVAWVALDEGDNEPVRFWRYLFAAFESALPGIALPHTEPLDPLESLDLSQTRSLEPQLTALINTLATISCELVLVLDDYHLITNQAVHDSINFLLEHLPASLHVYIAGRTDPPLPLPRLRMRNQLNELHIADLRFTLEEANLFLRQALDTALPEEDVNVLEERTEGWIAGLQLAALSMRGRKDVSEFIASFKGNHRYIANYLADEVLAQLPEHVYTFLLQTSILDRLSAPLCDAVTERTDSHNMLELLERMQLFIIPLDDEQRWYRYHHLFADMLQNRLQRLGSDVVGELHRRAYIWHAREGLISTAIEHALIARDFEEAAALLEQYIASQALSGEVNTRKRWLNALPFALVRSRIQLYFSYVWTLLDENKWEEIEVHLKYLEQILNEVQDFTRRQRLLSGIITVRAASAHYTGNGYLTMELTQRALAHVPDEDQVRRGSIMLYQAGAYWNLGEMEAAQRVLSEALRIHQENGHTFFAIIAMYMQTEIEAAFGYLHRAFERCRQAIQFGLENNGQASPTFFLLYISQARMHLEWNNIDKAAQSLHEANKQLQRSKDFRILPYIYFVQAYIEQAKGERQKAKTSMLRAEQTLKQHGSTYYNDQLLGFQANLNLLQGDYAAVERWFQAIPFKLDDVNQLWFENNIIIALHYMIYKGMHEKVHTLLEKHIEATKHARRNRSFIRFLILLALNYQMSDRTQQAVTTLLQALELAEPEGYIRTFVDEGEPMVSLLLEALAVQQRKNGPSTPAVSTSYIHRLLAACGLPIEARAEEQVGSVVLSTREIEVMRLIASGLSNQEICARLVIANSTLKTHINHIYSKLNVRSRTQAIIQARNLNLL